MDRLIELAKIVNKEKTKRLNIIGQEKEGTTSLTQKLFSGILSSKIQSDQEAATFLYGENYDKNTYFRTKYRLEDKLINTLFFINLSESHYSDFQKNYYKCNKDLAAVKFLIGKSARLAAVSLAEKTIRQAIKYEFTEIILELGRILKRHYRLINPNKEKAQNYINIVNYQKKVLELEILAEDFREEITSQFTPSRASQSFNVEKVTVYENILKQHLSTHSSYKLRLNYYQIVIPRYRILNEHEKVIEVCQEGLLYFEAVSNQKSSGPISICCIEIMISCISLKNYALGNKMFKKLMNITNEGSINWLISLEVYFLVCLHAKKYDEALLIFHMAIDHKNFKQMPSQYQEIWKVYDAYCHFLIETGYTMPSQKNKKKFRLGRFLNEVPQFSKDKQGINISILIIQVLFLLQRKKRDTIIERVDALTQYAYRYLIKDETLRSNCFIKMLAKMVKANFHKNATIRTSEKLLTKLKNTPSASKGQSQYVEIIPYEILWKMVLDHLMNRAI